MKLLLDTHSFIWFIEGNTRLSPRLRLLIADEANQVFLSTATLWEMAIKVSLGKLTLRQPFDILIPAQLHVNDITLLDITVEHTLTVAKLPLHHRDPFDRLLIAQALVEGLPIISVDNVLDQYGVIRTW